MTADPSILKHWFSSLDHSDLELKLFMVPPLEFPKFLLDLQEFWDPCLNQLRNSFRNLGEEFACPTNFPYKTGDSL
jgi:hypothetical protein